MKLSPHFELAELIPHGMGDADVPGDVLAALEMLCVNLLEPVRVHFGVAVKVHSGWRPGDHNADVGGKPTSDHLNGDASDIHVVESPGATWEANTIAAFHFLRVQRAGHFGQLILEDHRNHYRDPGKLWVHVSNPTRRHDGTINDRNRLLTSSAPEEYALWTA